MSRHGGMFFPFLAVAMLSLLGGASAIWAVSPCLHGWSLFSLAWVGVNGYLRWGSCYFCFFLQPMSHQRAQSSYGACRCDY